MVRQISINLRLICFQKHLVIIIVLISINPFQAALYLVISWSIIIIIIIIVIIIIMMIIIITIIIIIIIIIK